MRYVNLLLWATVSVVSCYRGTPTPSYEGHSPVSAVIKHPKKEVRRELEVGIREGLKAPVYFLEGSTIRTPIEAETEAAISGTSTVLLLHPAALKDSGFIAVSAYEVTTGRLLAETAHPIEEGKTLEREMREWAKMIGPTISRSAPLNVVDLAWRLKANQACPMVAKLTSEISNVSDDTLKKLHHILVHCRPTLIAGMDISKSSMITLDLVHVPSHLALLLGRAMQHSRLPSLALEIASQPTTLRIECVEGCKTGSIQLILPFDAEIYHTELIENSDLLAPLRVLARSMDDYLAEATSQMTPKSAKPFSAFAQSIILSDPPNDWVVQIRSEAGEAVLTPNEGVVNFLENSMREFRSE